MPLPPFGEIMMDILEKSGGDPMGGFRVDRNDMYIAPPKPKTKAVATEFQGRCVDALEAIGQEIWERTFFGYDRRVAEEPIDVKPERETEWKDVVTVDVEFEDNPIQTLALETKKIAPTVNGQC